MADAIEAVKHSLRQSKEGLVVSFVLHPNDDAAPLLAMPIGQRVILAVAPFAEPGADTAAPSSQQQRGSLTPAMSASPTSPPLSGPLPQVLPPPAPEGQTTAPPARPGAGSQPPRPRVPFHQKPLSQQAGMLCNDSAFRQRMTRKTNLVIHTPIGCEIWLKEYLDIRSFTQLDDNANSDKRDQFIRLVEDFEKATGRVGQ